MDTGTLITLGIFSDKPMTKWLIIIGKKINIHETQSIIRPTQRDKIQLERHEEDRNMVIGARVLFLLRKYSLPTLVRDFKGVHLIRERAKYQGPTYDYMPGAVYA